MVIKVTQGDNCCVIPYSALSRPFPFSPEHLIFWLSILESHVIVYKLIRAPTAKGGRIFYHTRQSIRAQLPPIDKQLSFLLAVFNSFGLCCVHRVKLNSYIMKNCAIIPICWQLQFLDKNPFTNRVPEDKTGENIEWAYSRISSTQSKARTTWHRGKMHCARAVLLLLVNAPLLKTIGKNNKLGFRPRVLKNLSSRHQT